MSESADAVSLREYVDRLFTEHTARFASVDSRFDKINHQVQEYQQVANSQAAIAESLKSFKEQVGLELKAHKEAVANAMVAAKEAVTKAEMANEKRFEGVNEFRATLADQQRTLMPRSEVDLALRALAEKIADIQSAMVESRASKGGMREGWAWAIGVFGFIVSVLLLINIFVNFRQVP